MKKYKNLFLLLVFLVASCTKLDETVYHNITTENFFKTEQEYISALGPAYLSMQQFFSETNTLFEESCSDEIVVPKRGPDWGEPWTTLHSHTWVATDWEIKNAWDYAYGVVNKSNNALLQIKNVKSTVDPKLKALFYGEFSVLRDWGYYHLIDLFGGVPLVKRFDIPTDTVLARTSRKDVFDFCVNDIKANLPGLTREVNQASYGRFNKWSAYALLAKFYLNAEVFSGTARWQDCITACDSIINSGLFSLQPNYFDCFAYNDGPQTKENILAVPFDQLKSDPWVWLLIWDTFDNDMNRIFGMANGGWNGLCAMPSFIHSFNPADKRLKGWVWGQQFAQNGDSIRCTGMDQPRPLNLTIDFTVLPPYKGHTPDNGIYDYSQAREYMGARLVKYSPGPNLTGWCMDNDPPVYRYADILMMKAECLMRLSGGAATSAAVDLVNQVRARAFDSDPAAYTTSTLTMDALLKERQWEFYGEFTRRNDMVRFGKFVRGTWEWADRSSESDTRNLFPIPQQVRDANSAIIQNPGY